MVGNYFMARMAYIGSCILDNNTIIPVLSMNSGIENSIQFYDHVVGLRDTNYTGTNIKGPETDNDKTGGYNNIQKKIYRYPPSIFKGKFSAPMSVDSSTLNVKSLIEYAIKGTEISQIDFIYFSSPDGSGTKEGHQIKNAVVESLTLTINAGEVANFDVSVVAKKNEGTPTVYKKSSCTKLLTWDQCVITSSLNGDIQAFSINIKNNVLPIYVSGPESDYITNSNYYGPKVLRLGMQEVTGNIGTYGFNTWNNISSDALKFKLGDDQWTLNVLYNPTPSSASGSNEPYVATTPFVGASNNAVWVKSS
jgi:hypothetical protein